MEGGAECSDSVQVRCLSEFLAAIAILPDFCTWQNFCLFMADYSRFSLFLAVFNANLKIEKLKKIKRKKNTGEKIKRVRGPSKKLRGKKIKRVQDTPKKLRGWQ